MEQLQQILKLENDLSKIEIRTFPYFAQTDHYD